MLAKEYNQNIEFSGPLLQEVKREGEGLRVTYTHASGLKTSDGTAPKSFAIAGEDGKWVWAETRIEGESLVLSSTEVKNPAWVRYAWADNPEVNLQNGAQLPAIPFSLQVPATQ